MIRLISNFIDYYDHYFDLQGEVFRRMTNEGMDRKEMIEFLKKHGLITPPCGIVREMQYHGLIRDDVYVVVHTDIHSHRGENKFLMLYKEALEKHPDAFMVLYVSSFTGVSWRYLRVGDRSFMLRYKSEDWRSNWDTSEIVIEQEDASDIEIDIDAPLFAIDFVKNVKPDGNPVMVAIDYNIAPQIKGTGVEELLEASIVADAIKSKLNKLNV